MTTMHTLAHQRRLLYGQEAAVGGNRRHIETNGLQPELMYKLTDKWSFQIHFKE